jgi:hypothetical protein
VLRVSKARSAPRAVTMRELRLAAAAAPRERARTRYLIPRSPERAVKLYRLLGARQARAVVMRTVGRWNRGSGYRLDQRRSLLEAVTHSALVETAINEMVHALVVLANVPVLVLFAVTGHYALLGLVAVVTVPQLWLIVVQRYNRARMIKAADRLLARGDTYRRDYRNWAGIDARAVDNHHAHHTPNCAEGRRTVVRVSTVVGAVGGIGWAIATLPVSAIGPLAVAAVVLVDGWLTVRALGLLRTVLGRPLWPRGD